MRRATYLLAWLLALPAYATVAVGFLPLFIFIDEVEGRYGEALSVVAFFVLPVGLASLAVWRLPEGYYRCHPFERRGRLYEMLGVRYFRMLVPHGDVINWLVRRSQRALRPPRSAAPPELFTLGRDAPREKKGHSGQSSANRNPMPTSRGRPIVPKSIPEERPESNPPLTYHSSVRFVPKSESCQSRFGGR